MGLAGKTVHIEYRYSVSGDYDRLPSLADSTKKLRAALVKQACTGR
jgi:hypothetical protein